MSLYVHHFEEIDKTKRSVAGGKGANLGELTQMNGIHVPDGFCISTEAFTRIIGESEPVSKLLAQLSLLELGNQGEISSLSSEIRSTIETIAIPVDIVNEISQHITEFGEKNTFAIRSSATAEDLPLASFAGQQDTYLNIIGTKAILAHISKCWASLFTDRAVTYRLQNGFDHRKVSLAVVVQKMVFPEVSGIMFTADPITFNRKVVSIDASFGLGEALVSGLVNADNYKVVGDKLVDKMIATKKLAIYPVKTGGTKKEKIGTEQQNRQALTDEQILHLSRIGREIEDHFGYPADIEWCLVDDTFYIVQSRPITTLFPIPETNDTENHVYVSVGHQQMMTDSIKPLGLSFFLLTTKAPMHKAGGRLFVDITKHLSTSAGRKAIMNSLGQSEPLLKDALLTITQREDFIKLSPEAEVVVSSSIISKELTWDFLEQFESNPAIVPDLMKNSKRSIEALQQTIKTKSGTDLLDFILEDLDELKKILFNPQSSEVIKIAMYASSWVNKHIDEWLGEKNVADKLSLSVSNNITSEMGLALLDVADVLRPYPELINQLQHISDDDFLEEIVQLDGGTEFQSAINAYLTKYGMRCSGEIDITRTRWGEKPAILIPMILRHIKNFEPNASKRKFEEGRKEAEQKEQMLLEQLKQLPDGEQKARETKRMIGLIRNLIGYREYPKYGMIHRYFVYKQALLKEAEHLVEANLIRETEDIYYLTFEELHDAACTNTLDYRIIDNRKEDYKIYDKLTPPRVLTSDGEAISGTYDRGNLPAKALQGLAVSTGVIEGRARIILSMENADLAEGDILVTTFTDPSWTPLFVSIKGLVTEVGGLMTHGAVIAREYGLPAVVGVEHATTLIKDGQRIRVDGTAGYVEII